MTDERSDECSVTSDLGQHNKRFEQSPDSNVSIHRNPGFYVYVWPLRARIPLDTAQLKRSVMARHGLSKTPIAVDRQRKLRQTQRVNVSFDRSATGTLHSTFGLAVRVSAIPGLLGWIYYDPYQEAVVELAQQYHYFKLRT